MHVYSLIVMVSDSRASPRVRAKRATENVEEKRKETNEEENLLQKKKEKKKNEALHTYTIASFCLQFVSYRSVHKEPLKEP